MVGAHTYRNNDGVKVIVAAIVDLNLREGRKRRVQLGYLQSCAFVRASFIFFVIVSLAVFSRGWHALQVHTLMYFAFLFLVLFPFFRITTWSLRL